jgi:hypothetical protein
MNNATADKTFTCSECGKSGPWGVAWKDHGNGTFSCCYACRKKVAVDALLGALGKLHMRKGMNGAFYIFSADREKVERAAREIGVPSSWIYWKEGRGKWVLKLWQSYAARGVAYKKKMEEEA